MALYKGTNPVSLNGANGRDGINGSGNGSAAISSYNIILNAEEDSTGAHGYGPGGTHAVAGTANAVGGYECEAHGTANFCYGYGSDCSGMSGNVAMGYGNSVTGSTQGTFCEGYNNTTSGSQGAHVEGNSNNVVNIGRGGHVEGGFNKIVGGSVYASHIEGLRNVVQVSDGIHIEGLDHGRSSDSTDYPIMVNNQGVHIEGKGHQYCFVSSDGGHQGGKNISLLSQKPPVSPNQSGYGSDLIEAIGGANDTLGNGMVIRTMDVNGNVGIMGDLVFQYNGDYYSLGEILKEVLASGITINPIQLT